MSSGYKSYTEEDQEDSAAFTPYQSLVFMLDCSPKMHVKENGQSFFESCLNAVIETIQNKINLRSKDQLSVLFYGTKQSKSLNGAISSHKSIYVAVDMNYPDLDDTMKLAKFRNWEYFDQEVGSSDEIQLGNVFWATSQLFSGKKQSQREKKVFMMTNNSDPTPNDEDGMSLASTRYKDLIENDISFFLLPLSDSFDIQGFYKNYIREEISEDEIKIYNGTDNLKNAISTFDNRARIVFKGPLILGEGLVCGIKGCYRIIESKKPSPCYLEEKTNQEIETLTTYCSGETGGVLKKEEISFAFDYGGVKAVFSKDEIGKMKNFGEPRLVLYGFYPKSWLKLKYNLKHSVFLFPDEEEYMGSSCLISNLIDVMIEKNVIAIALLVASPRSTPRFLALLPSQPNSQEQQDSVSVGFNGIFLPYKEDVRVIDSEIAPLGKPAAENLTCSIKSIIESLTIPNFSSKPFPNPELSLFYAGLVSMAQELDEMEQVQDQTRPNFDWINKEAGSHIKNCNQILESMGLNHPRPDMSDERPTKKLKKILELTDLESGKLEKFTVDQLTEAGTRILGIKKLPKIKKQLINAIEEKLESKK